jgi:hypothetical protein
VVPPQSPLNDGIRQLQTMIYDLLVLLVYYPWILERVRRLKDFVHLGSSTKEPSEMTAEARRS